jgi:7-keto-8-aminopelargonate synthetase-like enzyme
MLINFSSNDYLGLANDPQLREAATKAIAEFGIGAGASRLISETQSPHRRTFASKPRSKGAARLRITLSAAHEATQLRSLAGAIKRLPKRD